VNNKRRIEKQIKQIELQLARLSQQPNKNEVCDDITNSLILKKAILKKDLQDLNKNPIIEKFKRIIPKKEKLICDYF
jgi:hypothetical protein